MLHIDILKEFPDFPGNAEIYFGGDDHVGNVAFSEKGIKMLNRKVKSHKHGFMVKGGDQLECICVGDPRFNLNIHKGTKARVSAQINEWRGLHESVIDRILYLLWGNHEGKMSNLLDIVELLTQNTPIIDGKGYLVKVMFPGFRLMDWHGDGTVNSKAGDEHQRLVNEAIAVKRKLRQLPGDDCEISIMHHIHKMRIHPPSNALTIVSGFDNELHQAYKEPTRIWIDKDKGFYRFPEEERWYVSSGSTMRGYIEGTSTYVEMRGYRPTEMGCIRLSIKNEKIYKVEKITLG